MKLFEADIQEEIDVRYYMFINLSISILAFLSTGLSVAWIMMAKASKAWHTVYERAICKLEEEMEIPEEPTQSNLETLLGIPEKYRFKKLCELDNMDNNLFTINPGNYSLIGVNMLIGWGLLICSILVFVGHFIGFALLSYARYNDPSHTVQLLVCAIMLLGWVLFIEYGNVWTKSDTLSPPRK